MILCLVGFDIRFCLTNRISYIIYIYVIFTSFITLETKLVEWVATNQEEIREAERQLNLALQRSQGGCGLSHIDSTRYIMHV